MPCPGEYEGDITIVSSNAKDRPIRVVLTVGEDVAVNHGDDDPAKLTRLRWLNSQLAADDDIVPPYTPMTVRGRTVGVLGRTMSFGDDGFPASIRSYFTDGNTAIGTTAQEVLAAPVQLEVQDSAGKALAWRGDSATISKRARGAVAWNARRTSGALTMDVRAQMEFEGTTEYRVTLRADQRVALGDVRLEIPMRPEAARLMMGLGQQGGERPDVAALELGRREEEPGRRVDRERGRRAAVHAHGRALRAPAQHQLLSLEAARAPRQLGKCGQGRVRHRRGEARERRA